MKGYDSTVARIAGNIAAGLVQSPGFKFPSRFELTQEQVSLAVAELSVGIARLIVARVRDTEPAAYSDFQTPDLGPGEPR